MNKTSISSAEYFVFSSFKALTGKACLNIQTNKQTNKIITTDLKREKEFQFFFFLFFILERFLFLILIKIYTKVCKEDKIKVYLKL